jgi:hypothetical protein
MKTLADYHDLYLQSDVMLLTDIFVNFRNTCMTSYSLDPAHYYTAPGLSWDAMLKKTSANLQLLDNIDMVNMMQKGIRGLIFNLALSSVECFDSISSATIFGSGAKGQGIPNQLPENTCYLNHLLFS